MPADSTTSLLTEQRLEAITDTALFERIATAVLRIARPEYAGLLHLGINADGRTVRAPVDALGLDAAGDGIQPLILVAHTTTARAGLKRKWLAPAEAPRDSDPAPKADETAGGPGRGGDGRRRRRRATRPPEPGDIAKAAAVARAVRAETPTRPVTLVLTTNQVPETDLLKEVYATAAAAELKLDVFDRTLLAHTLNFTPDGQAVRRELLGIEADRMSRALLAELGRRSVDAYAREHPGVGPAEWVARDEDTGLASALGGPATLVALVGASGLGKSALAWRAADGALAQGWPALWVRAGHLADAASVTALVDAALREWHGAPLEPDAGGRALDLATSAGGAPGALLVVDDVMQQADPLAALRRVATLARALTEPGPPGPSRCVVRGGAVRLLVPVWPETWRALDEGYRRAPWVTSVGVEPLPMRVAGTFLAAALARRGLAFPGADVGHIAERLAGDPLLGALLVESAAHSAADLEAAVPRVIDQFIASVIARLALEPHARSSGAQYRAALAALAERMLRHRRLAPSAEDVGCWFADDATRGALRDLARDGRILREEGGHARDDAGRDTRHDARDAGVPLLRFRHDRLRDALLVDALLARHERRERDARGTGGGASALDLPASDPLFDPLFAHHAGALLTRVPHSRAELERFCALSPVTLAEALRAGAATFPGRRAVVEVLQEWVQTRLSALGDVDRLPPREAAVLNVLAASRRPDSLALLEPWPRWHGVEFARLAAGDVAAGVRYFEAVGFEGNVRDEWRDSALREALTREPSAVLDTARRALSDVDAPWARRVASLTLAGHLAAAELAAPVAEALAAWLPTTVEDGPLAAASIWAVLRTADEQPALAVATALDVWRRVPTDPPTNPPSNPLGTSRRDDLTVDLTHALAETMDTGVVRALAAALGEEQARVDGSLVEDLAELLSTVDHPDAQEAIIRFYAGTASEEAAGGRALDLRRRWERRSQVRGHERSLSGPTRARLQVLWQAESEGAAVRTLALALWSANASPEDVAALRTVSGDPTDRGLARTALWERLGLGDATAVPDALALARAAPFWYRRLGQVWDARVREAVRAELRAVARVARGERAGDPRVSGSDGAGDERTDWRETLHAIGNLLAGAPPDEATSLLRDAWPELGRLPEMARVAAAVASAESAAMVHEAAAAGVDMAEALRFVHHDWGALTPSWTPTDSQLAVVEPYVGLLKPTFQAALARGCRRRGAYRWAEVYLVPHLTPDDRARAFPSDEDLQNVLAQTVRDYAGRPLRQRLWSLGHLFERWSEDPMLRPRVVPAVLRHLSRTPDMEALEIAAFAVQLVGTRAHLPDFRAAAARVPGDAAEIAEVVRQTEFAVRYHTGEGEEDANAVTA